MSSIISEMITRSKEYFRNLNYAENTLRQYYKTWSFFEHFCNENGYAVPTREDSEKFMRSRGITPDTKLSIWQRHQTRHIRILFDIWEYGECPRKYGVQKFPLPGCYRDAFESYNGDLSTQGISERTIYGKKSLTRKFFNYIESIGIRNIKNLNRKHIYEYLSLANSPRTQSYIKFFLREFLSFLVNNHEAQPDLATMFPVILENKRGALPSVYTAEELRSAYEQLNDELCCAKRNRAVLLLAYQLGMRAGDIIKLKQESIDWRLQKISFTQQKTKRKIFLPLPDECMFALLDYLKNERPQIDDPYIFLGSRAPYKPLSEYNSYHRVISDCYKNAGVDTKGKHRGLHSVRHSMAVNMLLSDIPYPVITGVLGHESANTTKAYLRVDTERLRSLCLEVPHGY